MTAVYQIDTGRRRGAGEFSGTLIASAAGVAAALITDFVQKGDASALIVMNTITNSVLNMNIPILYQGLGLLAVGALAVFMFEPQSKKAAFSMGASMLAVLLTVMPVNSFADLVPVVDELRPLLNGTLPQATLMTPGIADETAPTTESTTAPATAPITAPTSEPATAPATAPTTEPATTPAAPSADDGAMLDTPADNKTGLMHAAFMPSWGKSAAKDAVSGLTIAIDATDQIPVILTLNVPTDTLPSLTVRLHDDTSGRTWDLSASGQAQRTETGYVIRYVTAIPPAAAQAGGVLANLQFRIEAPGYEIAELDGGRVTAMNTPVEVKLDLKPSSTPLMWQRLNKSFKF